MDGILEVRCGLCVSCWWYLCSWLFGEFEWFCDECQWFWGVYVVWFGEQVQQCLGEDVEIVLWLLVFLELWCVVGQLLNIDIDLWVWFDECGWIVCFVCLCSDVELIENELWCVLMDCLLCLLLLEYMLQLIELWICFMFGCQ